MTITPSGQLAVRLMHRSPASSQGHLTIEHSRGCSTFSEALCGAHRHCAARFCIERCLLSCLPQAATLMTTPPASNGIAGGLLTTPLPCGEDTPFRTLRETYGSIPAASSPDRKAFDTSIALAVAQLAAANAALADKPAGSTVGDNTARADAALATTKHCAAGATSTAPVRGDLLRAPKIAPVSTTCMVVPAAAMSRGLVPGQLGCQCLAAPDTPGTAHAAELPRTAALPASTSDSHSAAQQHGRLAPSATPPPAVSAASSASKPSTAASPGVTAATPQAAAGSRWRPASLGLLVTLLCVLGIGLLAACDPVQGRMSVDTAARRAHRLAAAGAAGSHRAHAAALYAARHGPAYAQQVAREGWHGVEAAAAAGGRAVASAPAAAQRLWRHSTAVLAADTRAVLASARRMAASVAASADHAAAASVRAAQHVTTWPAALASLRCRCVSPLLLLLPCMAVRSLRLMPGLQCTTLRYRHNCMLSLVQGLLGISSDSRARRPCLHGRRHSHGSNCCDRHAAAGLAPNGCCSRLHRRVRFLCWPCLPVATIVLVSRKLRAIQTSLVMLLLSSRVPGSRAELATAMLAAGSATQHAGVVSVVAAQRLLQDAWRWLAHLLSAAPPPPSRPATPAKAAVEPQRLPRAFSRTRAPTARSAHQPQLGRVTSAPVKPAASAPAKSQHRVAQHAPGGSNGLAAKPTTISSSTRGADAGGSTKRAAASPAAMRSPAAHGLPAPAGDIRTPPGRAAGPGICASAAAAGCLAALAVCVVLAVAYWLRWLPRAPAVQDERLDSTGALLHAPHRVQHVWQWPCQTAHPCLHCATRQHTTCGSCSALSAGDVDVYGGPDAGDPSELFEPFDGLDLDTAMPLGINRRRHTIATTQPQETLSLVLHTTCLSPLPV
jgi:hypothetical protein